MYNPVIISHVNALQFSSKCSFPRSQLLTRYVVQYYGQEKHDCLSQTFSNFSVSGGMNHVEDRLIYINFVDVKSFTLDGST